VTGTYASLHTGFSEFEAASPVMQAAQTAKRRMMRHSTPIAMASVPMPNLPIPKQS